jgi:transposase InsO family protein
MRTCLHFGISAWDTCPLPLSGNWGRTRHRRCRPLRPTPPFAADTALPFCAPCAMGKATRRPHPSPAGGDGEGDGAPGGGPHGRVWTSALAENQLRKKLRRIRCDNGGEYTSTAFRSLCRERGIVVEYSPPYSPQSNGAAERINRTLQDRVRCMLVHAQLPQSFWGEALRAAAFLLNRSPTRALVGAAATPHGVLRCAALR